MLLRTALIALTLTTAGAGAADLPAHTKLGALFADQPSARVIVTQAELPVPFVPWLGTSPRIAGYYGTWGDFYYTNYYGTSPFLIFSRPPYSCAWYGGHCW